MPSKPWNTQKVNQLVPQGASAIATNRAALLKLRDLLVDVRGCSVVKSCDSAAVASTDLWVDATKLVWANPGTAHSWVVFAFVGGDQLLASLEGADANGATVTMFWSPAAGFTGGTTTARPTATDEMAACPTTSVLFAANGHYVLHQVSSNDGASVVVSVMRAGASCGLLWAGPVAGAPSGWGASPAAHFLGYAADVATGLAANWSAWSNATNPMRAKQGANLMNLVPTVEGWGATPTPEAFTGANEITGRWRLWPVGLVSTTTPKGRHGWVDDVYYVAHAINTGERVKAASGDTYVQLGEIAVPWTPGLACTVDASGTPVDVEVNADVSLMPTGGGDLLALSPAEGALSADPEVARWTPVALAIDVPAGFVAVVVARVGADSWFWSAAFDGTLAAGGDQTKGFSPAYESKSSAVVTGTAAGGRRYVLSVLPNGGWQRPDVALVPYLAREARDGGVYLPNYLGVMGV